MLGNSSIIQKKNNWTELFIGLHLRNYMLTKVSFTLILTLVESLFKWITTPISCYTFIVNVTQKKRKKEVVDVLISILKQKRYNKRIWGSFKARQKRHCVLTL